MCSIVLSDMLVAGPPVKLDQHGRPGPFVGLVWIGISSATVAGSKLQRSMAAVLT